VALAIAAAGALAGCASEPPATSAPLIPRGEVVRQASGEVVMVRDVTIDLSREARMRTPRVPIPVPIGIGILHVPMRVPTAGTAQEAPGEELTIRLSNRESVLVVQERSDPPLAIGERVRVLYEEADPTTGKSKMRVERE